jgi:hypothetical protein
MRNARGSAQTMHNFLHQMGKLPFVKVEFSPSHANAKDG